MTFPITFYFASAISISNSRTDCSGFARSIAGRAISYVRAHPDPTLCAVFRRATQLFLMVRTLTAEFYGPRYGVAVRIDPDGSLVVGKAGAKAEEPTQPWPSLIRAIEAHTDAVARLVEAGWMLRANFPKEAA